MEGCGPRRDLGGRADLGGRWSSESRWPCKERSSGYQRGVDLSEIEAMAPSEQDLGEIKATGEVTRGRSQGGLIEKIDI